MVLVVSSWKLGRRPRIRVEPVLVPADAESVARGAHLSRILGCIGCHGSDLGGAVFIDEPMFGRLVAPNLTRIREHYSDEDFVRLLRHGLRPAGRNVLPAMPSQAFTHLADDDLASIIAWVRSVPAVGDTLPSTRLAFPLRAMLAAGVIDPVPDLIDHARPPRRSVDRSDPIALGEYLARIACSECHGADLRGNDRFLITPNLAIVATYPLDQFRDLMRTGLAAGGRELDTMSPVARSRFAGLTDDEIDALYRYLGTLGKTAIGTR